MKFTSTTLPAKPARLISLRFWSVRTILGSRWPIFDITNMNALGIRSLRVHHQSEVHHYAWCEPGQCFSVAHGNGHDHGAHVSGDALARHKNGPMGSINFQHQPGG